MFFRQKKSPELPPIETFKLGSRYYFARLCPDDRKWYREIYDAWLTGASEVCLNMPGTKFETPSGTAFLDLVLAVVEDNPHLFHVERTDFHFRRLGSKVWITSKNIYTPEEFRQTYELLKQRVTQILTAAKKFSNKFDQVRFLHDYLAASITYDYCESNPKTAREAHTIVGALLNRRCVCDGYARAFRLLCDRLGISCIVVIGEGPTDATPEGHAWNIVKLDRVPYHVDVTWDSSCTEGRVVKDFEFMLGDASAGRRHSWDKTAYPRCPRDWPRREKLLSTVPELEEELVRHLREKHHSFMLRLDGPLRSQATFTQNLGQLHRKHASLYPKKGDLMTYFYDKYGYAEFIYVPNTQKGEGSHEYD